MKDMTRWSKADWKPPSSDRICDDAHSTSIFSLNENLSVSNWYCVPRVPKEYDDLSHVSRSTVTTGTVNGGARGRYGLKYIVRFELANALPRGGISAHVILLISLNAPVG
jgi:hypothetical protein